MLSSGGDPDLLDMLRNASMPQVVVDRELEDLAADLVEVDHEGGARLAVEHLIALGHTRIACIAGPLALSPARQRVQGWRGALAAAGLAGDETLVAVGSFTAEGGHAAMRALLERRPSAVFASNDLMAIGAICAAAEAGLRVPQDLSVIGFDDIALAAFSNPPLTTIAQPKHQTGELAARMLLQRIAKPKRPLQREILRPTLVLRRSTATPGAR